MADQVRFDDRVAVVTGSGGGLGRAHALLLASLGAKVVVNDLGGAMDGTGSETTAAQKVVDEIKEAGGEATPNFDSVSDWESAQKIVGTAIDTYGKIDILINNSGATWGAPTEEYPIKGWKKVIDVNVTGTFICSQTLGKAMIQGGGGKIINVSSVFGGVGVISPIMDAIAYNTSKGAIEAFTKDLAVKWAKYKVYVNAIAPSFIETDMTQVTMERGGEHILAHTPLKRFGLPEDLKGIVVFLSSEASDYMTGGIYFVDGGFRAM